MHSRTLHTHKKRRAELSVLSASIILSNLHNNSSMFCTEMDVRVTRHVVCACVFKLDGVKPVYGQCGPALMMC